MELVGAIGLEPTTPTMSILQCGYAVVRRQLLTLLGSASERPQMPERDLSGPTVGPFRLSSDDLVVFGMRPNPEPNDTVRRFDPDGAITDADASRIETADFLEV